MVKVTDSGRAAELVVRPRRAAPRNDADGY